MDATNITTASAIGSNKVLAPVGVNIEKAISGQPSTSSLVEGTMEFSPAGRALARAEVRSFVRRAWILDSRAEINAGTFLTPERMDGTFERLLDTLG